MFDSLSSFFGSGTFSMTASRSDSTFSQVLALTLIISSLLQPRSDIISFPTLS